MAAEVRQLKNRGFFADQILARAGPCVWLSHFLISTFPISISDFLFPRSLFYNYPYPGPGTQVPMHMRIPGAGRAGLSRARLRAGRPIQEARAS